MVNVTTLMIYLSGSLETPIWSGDIASNHNITVSPGGSAVIEIELVDFVDGGGLPVTFGADPITFVPPPHDPPWPLGKPAFISWALMSPTQLLITDMNARSEKVGFTLFGSMVDPSTGAFVKPIDPTIVNTYEPPP